MGCLNRQTSLFWGRQGFVVQPMFKAQTLILIYRANVACSLSSGKCLRGQTDFERLGRGDSNHQTRSSSRSKRPSPMLYLLSYCVPFFITRRHYGCRVYAWSKSFFMRRANPSAMRSCISVAATSSAYFALYHELVILSSAIFSFSSFSFSCL